MLPQPCRYTSTLLSWLHQGAGSVSKTPLFYGAFRRFNETPPVSMDLASSHAEWLIVSYLSYASYD
jgi:hypothetical protein